MTALLLCSLLQLAPAQAAGPGAPAAAVTSPPAAPASTPWLQATWARVRARLPSPLGWAGLVGLSISGVVVAGGLALSLGSAGLVWRGRALLDQSDAVSLDGTVETERSQLRLLKQGRDSLDQARVLALVGATTLALGLLCSALAATVVVVDETLFVPALRSPHPLWSILGPVVGERDPPRTWPDIPRPDVPGVFTPPRPRATIPAAPATPEAPAPTGAAPAAQTTPPAPTAPSTPAPSP